MSGRPRLALAVLLVTAVSCGGSPKQPPTDPGFTVERVVVAPGQAVVEPGRSVAFQATVEGTGDVPQRVVWTVASDPAGDTAVGTIRSDGTYVAPSVVSATRVQVRAASVADPTQSGIAIVELPAPGISISPSVADVIAGERVQFVATVTGAADTTVGWIGLGIDADGVLQTPPDGYYGDFEVSARSWVLGMTATATVRIRPRPPVLTGTSGSAAAGETLTVFGTGFRLVGGAPIVSFPAVVGDRILAVSTPYPDRITVVVPSGAASGPLWVEHRAHGLASASNEVPFVRAPRIRLHADRQDLSAGESTRLRLAFLGAPPAPITFETDVGTILGDEYVAPPAIDRTTYASVRACVTGTSNCGGVLIGVHPFLVRPESPLVASGASLDLSAQTGGAEIPATFSMQTGGGAVTAGGQYVASPALVDAGQAWVKVDDGARAIAEQIGVTGLVPGLVARVVDYVDHASTNAPYGIRWGTWVEALAIDGGRAYVAGGPPEVVDCYPGSGCPAPYPDGSPTYFWIDVYDLAIPTHPRWLGAVECPMRPMGMFASHGRLYAWSTWDPTANWWSSVADSLMTWAGTLVAYDLSSDLPSIVLRDVDAPPLSTLGKPPPVHDGEFLFDFGFVRWGTPSLELRVHALADQASASPRVLTLEFPPDCEPQALATAAGDRAYATCSEGTITGQRLIAWDLAADPPVLLGGVEESGIPTVLGPLLAMSRPRELVLYDRGPDVPVPVATLYVEGASLPVAEDAGRVLLQGGPRVWRDAAGGTYVLDVSDPGAPRLASAVYGGQHVRGSGAFVGDLAYSAEGLGGIAIYDVSEAGGPLPRSRLDLPPYVCNVEVWSGFVRRDHLFASAWWGCMYGTGTFFAVWDVSTSPPRLTWNQRRDWEPDPIRIAEWGDRVALGTPVALEVWSAAEPTAPTLLSSLPVEVSCLATDASVLWAGTYGGDLLAATVDGSGALQVAAVVPLDAPPSAMGLLAPGRLAIALGGSSPELLVLDASAGGGGAVLGRTAVAARVNEIAFDGTIALLATDAGLVTVDVSDEQHPVAVGSAPLPAPLPYGEAYISGAADTVTFLDGIAWVGSYQGGGTTHGFDVRDPRFPREIAGQAYAVLSSLRTIVPDGGRAFVGGTGILEIDLARPRNVVKTLTAPRSLQR